MILWFGDSWLIGSDLPMVTGKNLRPSKRYPNLAPGFDDPEAAFTTIVSNHFGHDFIVYAQGGSSIHYQLRWLYQLYKHGIDFNEPVIALYSHTGELRRYGIDLNGNHIHEGSSYGLDTLIESDNYTNREQFSVYDYTVALNHFYLICRNLNWDFLSFNTWCSSQLIESENIVPCQNFLHSNDQYMTSDFAKIYPVYEELLEALINPCIQHANCNGHRVLADRLIEDLESNLIFNNYRRKCDARSTI